MRTLPHWSAEPSNEQRGDGRRDGGALLKLLVTLLFLANPAMAPAQDGQPAHLARPLSRGARAAAAGGPVTAKSESLGRETDLGRTPQQEEFNPLRQSIAVLPGGGFAVAWTEVGFTASSGVTYRNARLQYVTASGALALPAGGLLLAPSFLDNYPVVLASHPTSGVFVAYGRGLGSPDEVMVQWVDGEGRTRWPEGGVSAFGPKVELVEYPDPYVLPAADGGVFVCAVRFRHFPFDETLVCQNLGPTGEPRWSASGIAVGGRRHREGLPKAVSDGEGGLLVFWLNSGSQVDQRVDFILVEGQRIASDGQRLWGAQGKLVRRLNLNENFRIGWHDLDAVTDGAGGAVVAFADWTPRLSKYLQTHAQRVTRDGRLLWGRGVAVAARGHHAELDALMAVGDGGAIVNAWSANFVTADPVHTWVQSYRLSATGQQVWGSEGLPLSDPGAKGIDFASYGQVDEGRLRAVWSHESGALTNQFDVHFAEISLDGERLVPAEGLPLTSPPRQKYLKGFAYDPEHGRGLAAYLDTPDVFTLDLGAWDAAATLYPPP